TVYLQKKSNGISIKNLKGSWEKLLPASCVTTPLKIPLMLGILVKLLEPLPFLATSLIEPSLARSRQTFWRPDMFLQDYLEIATHARRGSDESKLCSSVTPPPVNTHGSSCLVSPPTAEILKRWKKKTGLLLERLRSGEILGAMDCSSSQIYCY
ncbi:hypothetical protein J0S82_002401, partial [Galemys pyrenaicus]